MRVPTFTEQSGPGERNTGAPLGRVGSFFHGVLSLSLAQRRASPQSSFFERSRDRSEWRQCASMCPSTIHLSPSLSLNLCLSRNRERGAWLFLTACEGERGRDTMKLDRSRSRLQLPVKTKRNASATGTPLLATVLRHPVPCGYFTFAQPDSLSLSLSHPIGFVLTVHYSESSLAKPR